MKVIYDNDNTINFSKLKVLDVFTVGCEVYMKIKLASYEGRCINCININTGDFYCFELSIPVRKFETELHIVG